MRDLSEATREELLSMLAEVLEENARLRARVEELEARLGQDSSNSSRPPSADPPHRPPRQRGKPSGRRPGGQPGHQAHQRSLAPAEQVDGMVEHWPVACARCGQALTAGVAAGEPVRHQVQDLPPVRAEVTEHRLHRVRCPRCGRETRATLPAGVPRGAFGPRLQAVVTVLSGRYRLSRREVAGICDDLLGVPLAVGSVDGLCRATGQALAAPVQEVKAAVHTAPVVNVDETGWRQAGERHWLWGAVSGVATLFTIARSRSQQVLVDLLGEDFRGLVGSDRWSAYSWLPPERRQLCWAHLKREFQGLADWGGRVGPVGEEALALTERLFRVWHEARAEPEVLAARMAPVQAQFRALLEREQAHPAPKVAGLCRNLLKLWPALWLFARAPGVEPTNNAAERALRPAVLWRKGSFGTQSPEGSVLAARILSVAATCQQQGRSLLAYLTAVCQAAQAARPIPSLLAHSIPS